MDSASALLGRGMSDNPLHVAVHGGNDSQRSRRHALLMRTLLTHSPSMTVTGVEQDGTLLGVAASTPPGHCQPPPATRLGLLLRTATFGPRTSRRLLAWNRAWACRDLPGPHVHLGPIAVDRHLRGRGIGGLLMLRVVDELDAAGAVGYLETDRPEAVAFYRRFGFTVIDQAAVLGVPNWFMRRQPTRPAR